MNMSLLTVRNQEEFDFLKSLIGLRYNAYKLEGVWKWISSGDDISEFFWHDGEPNNESGHEKCIHTWNGFFDWNDNDCDRNLPFICEGENV
ncbi:hypothetical protein FF38_07353 [Lucilia cuprina]|uniref:C-type lectin domain-containing protein n=1 Tax=Lucilia cuprina TaxID=7375 RepID=A0A0L0CL96_LUCCU|nr:C-type lectin lectoxin-Enh7 [Lucilia cuprina]KNC33016.1 hypothetical protein FF38_07353 [Lucilia cuprina]